MKKRNLPARQKLAGSITISSSARLLGGTIIPLSRTQAKRLARGEITIYECIPPGMQLESGDEVSLDYPGLTETIYAYIPPGIS